MILYHGTSASRLQSILKEGLVPNKPGNWKGKLASRWGYVYLSAAFPALYATYASREGDQGVILEVDVAGIDLYPDEDFLWSAGLKKRPKNLDRWRHVAMDSLNHMGTVAVKGVAPDRILRHREIGNDFFMASRIGADLSVSPTAYKVLGPQYRKRIEVFMDGGYDAVQIQQAKDEWGV